MTGAIGDIAVRVGGDITPLTEAYEKGLAHTQAFSSKSIKSLRGVTDNIVKMGAAATATAAGGLLALQKSANSAGREIINLSRVSNAAPAEFQKMAIGAAQFDIEAEKLSDILKDVNDRVGDFLTTGGGPMADFFERIAPKVGITADNFRNLSGPQALQLYVSSLEKANVSQAEMTFFLEAMAGDLTKLQPLLANNGKLLKEAGDRAQSFGLIISDFDLAQLEDGARSFAAITSAGEKLTLLIGAKLAPFVNELTNRFITSKVEGQKLGDTISSSIETAIRHVAFMADAVHGLKVVLKGAELIGVGFGAAVASAAQLGTEAIVLFADTALKATNEVISQLNKIPGVDIANVGLLTNSEFMRDMRAGGEELRNLVGQTRGELQALAMQELPSSGLDAFFDSVKARALETAQNVNNLKLSIDGLAGSDEENQELIKKMTERQKLEAWHLGEMQKLNQLSFDGIQKLMQKRWGMATAQTAGAMKNILGTMSQSSRKAFEISKAWAIADALISTFQGIAAGVRLGWPMAIPAVAWAAATGFAQVSAIRSQKFGGGGGGGAAQAVGSAPQAQAAQATPATQGQTLTLAPIDPNALFSGQVVAGLAQRLVDFQRDGGTVVLSQ